MVLYDFLAFFPLRIKKPLKAEKLYLTELTK